VALRLSQNHKAGIFRRIDYGALPAYSGSDLGCAVKYGKSFFPMLVIQFSDRSGLKFEFHMNFIDS